ncbi:alanine:cation symporter family protein [Oligoflexaceae bacterium]|nr:alanine:cation symporter family protein [Oligoflexaceae bacterium]
MQNFAASMNDIMADINGVLWHDSVLYIILGTGTFFLLWSLFQRITHFSPFVAITHGLAVVRGKYDKKNDPGAISHFEALSAALSATVGLGNIGGVAVAIALGGPGAVFWMWIVGFVGMALKMTEVTQSMMYRDTSDPDNPHGGPMWVASKGLAEMSPKLAWLGKWIGGIFCVTLLISTVTGGNMFQAWSVGDVTLKNFGVPNIVTGAVLAVICGMVIIGGIKRIGQVAGTLVPFMCGLYLVAGLVVIGMNIEIIPEMFALIFKSAFSPTEAKGAFVGAAAGTAFMWGMKRALFSNEAGQGSAPIAHSAARTEEPAREGIVAGLEPFIDTIIVCTITALVLLSTGAWNRDATALLPDSPQFTETSQGVWGASETELPELTEDGIESWQDGQSVFMIASLTDGPSKIFGEIHQKDGSLVVFWKDVQSSAAPTFTDNGVYIEYASASLTSFAFDLSINGLGKWLVTIAAWLFAISTMISWSYYGEQGVVYLFGEKAVFSYKIIYCILIVVSTSGLITTTTELDNLTGIGTGVMLFANIPIMFIFARKSMGAYKEYLVKLRNGEFKRTS